MKPLVYTKGMSIIKGLGDFFALDIGTNAVRLVQLSGSGSSWSLQNYAYVPVDIKVSGSDSRESAHKLGEIITTAIGQSGVKTKDVVIGLPSNKTFTTVVDVPISSEADLKSAMKYQVDQYIPGNIDETKVDWALLGPSLRAQNKQEVLITSVASAYSEQRLELVEQLGYNVIAMEPDPIAMIRALVPPNNQSAILLIDMGEHSTDIAVVYNDTPRLIRSVPTGFTTFIKATTQNLNVEEAQARQFMLRFGLAPDKLDGQVYRAVETTLNIFVAEVEKSIKFFQTRYDNVAIQQVVVASFAATVPKLSDHLMSKVNIPVQAASPWQGVKMSQEAQKTLTPVANEFAVAVGLAKRGQV